MSKFHIMLVVVGVVLALAGWAPAQAALPADSCDSMDPGNVYNTGPGSPGLITWDDVDYLNDYLCRGGPAPMPLSNGDPNGDCIIDAADVAYLENYLLTGQNPPVDCTCLNPATGECTHDYCLGQNPGDADGSGYHNVGDAVYLMKFLCSGGPAPVPLANGDYNGDGVIDSLDVYGSFMYIWKCRNAGKCGYPPPVPCAGEEPTIGVYFQDPCFGAQAGDANGDESVDLGDAVYMINYIFKDGFSPKPYDFFNGDVNHDCQTNVGDAVYIINNVFHGGPGPVGCDDWIQSCGCHNLTIAWLFRWGK